jgi:hypothetical protein
MAVQQITIDRLLAALFFLAVIAAGATVGFESDSWWQLRAGQLTWQSGFVWTTDPLSWTAAGAPWPNHEWLSQVLFYLAYLAAGPGGVVALVTVASLATWLAVAALCGGPEPLRVFGLALGVIASAIFWSLRPHVFSLLGLATLLLLLRARRRWPIPALFLLWANLHGGVAYGGAVLVLAAGISVWYQRSSWLTWLLLVAASALATLGTPLGIGLWLYDLSRFTQGQTPNLREWMPPALDWPLSYPFFLLTALWLGLIGVSWRRIWRRLAAPEGTWTLTLLLVGALFLLIGFGAIRNTIFFALVAPPLIVDLARPLLPVRPVRSPDRRRGLAHCCLIVLAAAAAAYGVSTIWRSEPRRLQPLAPDAITAVRACPGPLYNTYVLGGSILWFIPERPVFVDSREDPYQPTLMPEIVAAELSGDYQALFTRFQPTCAIAERRERMAAALAADPAWAQTYADQQVVVFARR